jgi:hypothetical protein
MQKKKEHVTLFLPNTREKQQRTLIKQNVAQKRLLPLLINTTQIENNDGALCCTLRILSSTPWK